MPEDQENLDLALNASKIHAALWQFQSWIRSETKHAEDSERVTALLEANAWLYGLLDDFGVKLP